MRRALVIAGVIVAGRLAAVPPLAAAPVRAARAEVEREVTLLLHAEGFLVLFDTTDNDGELSAYLEIARGRQTATYGVPVEITADTVKARFGALGELDYHYAPKARTGTGNESETEGKAHFEGTFTFTGENGYVHIDADSADGVYHVYRPYGRARARRLRRAVPYHPSYSAEGMTLEAKAGSRARGLIRDISVYDSGRRGPRGVFAVLAEEREGMTVQRGVRLTARTIGFRWSLERGTAMLRPPAPFTGSAHFTRRGGNGRGTWTGSLAMPILGGDPVRLAGPEFRAFIHKGVPQDE
jgi:hypothetical protein